MTCFYCVTHIESDRSRSAGEVVWKQSLKQLCNTKPQLHIPNLVKGIWIGSHHCTTNHGMMIRHWQVEKGRQMETGICESQNPSRKLPWVPIIHIKRSHELTWRFDKCLRTESISSRSPFLVKKSPRGVKMEIRQRNMGTLTRMSTWMVILSPSLLMRWIWLRNFQYLRALLGRS